MTNLKKTLFIVFITFFLCSVVNGATVMGIGLKEKNFRSKNKFLTSFLDFGSDSIKVAVIKGTTFEVVINKESKRKTLNAVGFTKTLERVFGNRAEALVNFLHFALKYLLPLKSFFPVGEK